MNVLFCRKNLILNGIGVFGEDNILSVGIHGLIALLFVLRVQFNLLMIIASHF